MKVAAHILQNIFLRNVPLARKTSRTVCVGRCVKCGDSKKDRKKTRMFLLTKKDPAVVYCHNCGLSTTAIKFIKNYFPTAYNSIISQIYESYNNKAVLEEPEKATFTDSLNSSDQFKEIVDFLKQECTSLGNGLLGPDEQRSIRYLQKRMIPEGQIRKMYYCGSSAKREKFKNYIIIPYYNEFGIPYYFQGRYFGSEERSRFITSDFECCPDKAMLNEKTVDPSKTVFIMEGTLDSMNVENSICIAGCGINEDIIDYISEKFCDTIWLNDNDPAGKELTERLCKQNMTCFIWPKELKVKDINDLAIKTNRTIIPTSWIKQHSHRGSRGLFMML